MAKKVKKTAKKKTTGAKRTVKKVSKKKTAKKKMAAPKRTVKRQRKSSLTVEEISKLRTALLEKRKELIGDVNCMESEALRKSRLDAAGDLSSMPIHMADIGTDNFEQEFALGLMDSERKLLSEINQALVRIAEGTYGICEGTGKAIPKARLNAQPWAKYCVEYAEMIEKGLVTENEGMYEQFDDYDEQPDEEGDEDSDELDTEEDVEEKEEFDRFNYGEIEEDEEEEEEY